MKHIRLITSFLIIILLCLSLYNCERKCDIKGKFYISQNVRKYQIDTTISSFKMVDNYGITEEFYMDKNIWFKTHHYFNEWGSDCEAFGETFGVAYNSSLNDYFFMFVLRADVQDTDLEVEWNQRDRFDYNFGDKKVTYGVIPKILFYDSLVVRGKTYNDIIEIDYSNKINQIDDNTPVITYISGDKGLVKFIRKDNVIMERIE